MADELNNALEFIPDRLYFVTLRTTPRQTPNAHFFSIDNELVYEPFFADFGPLHMGCLYRYSKVLNQKLNDPQHAKKKIYHYTSNDGHKRACGATLICCYAVMFLNRTPEDAYRPFMGIYPPFIPFRDASYGVSTFNLTILDVVRGLYKAKENKFIDFDNFDLQEYEYFEKVENGDFNWTLPGKFISFSGPQATRIEIGPGIYMCTPEDYIPHFKRMGVTGVVRTNKKLYDKRRFTDHGIRHYEMYFIDGSTPPENILRKFLEVAENEPGVVAVHCKAGLGRTGSLIAAYTMKHYKFTAPEIIGWLRLMRPGSIIGPQQHWLKEWEARMWRAGDEYRKKYGNYPPCPGPLSEPGKGRPQNIEALQEGSQSPGGGSPGPYGRTLRSTNPSSPVRGIQPMNDRMRQTEQAYGSAYGSPIRGRAAPMGSRTNQSPVKQSSRTPTPTDDVAMGFGKVTGRGVTTRSQAQASPNGRRAAPRAPGGSMGRYSMR